MSEEIDRIVSDAAKRNWKRLGVENPAERLVSRANKRMSKKNIIPVEYASSPSSAEWISGLIRQVDAYRWNIPSVMYSLCLNLLTAASSAPLPPIESAFCGLPEYAPIEPLLSMKLPKDERDLLGLAYQSLLSEGTRNRAGIYYTPPSIVSDMTHDLSSFSGRCIDPCCGSGAFLTALLEKGIPPENIFGCDIDPVAVMIARTNLLIACRGAAIPKIVCADFLRDTLPFPDSFDLIITNPPWGALSEPLRFNDFSSSESFSCFLCTACGRLSKSGFLRFLLPESVLNVRTHRAVRRYLLTRQHIRQIRFFDESFSGVTSRCISMEVRSAAENDLIHFCGTHIDAHISSALYLRDADCTLRPLTAVDTRIIEKISSRGAHTLKNSIWALGIVTGDNKGKLLDAPAEGFEPILTGKEVEPYVPKPAAKYIRYDRAALQQSAKDEYYRAKEKLVYRFISDRPLFALDTSGSLCLNSANILIPRVEGLSLYTVLALLNSTPIQYMYMKLCGGVKILKSQLEKLPLPALTKSQDEYISSQVHAILCAAPADRRALCGSLNTYFCAVFDLSEEEQAHILETLRI